jgi:hypothetical protein
MNDRIDDEARLRRLLSDAVSDIEPESRLDELRASVHPRPKVVPMTRSRSWYAATGIVATAAVIGVIAYVTSMAIDKNTNVGPATDPGTSLPPVTATATDTALASHSPGTDTQWHAAAVYYLGDGPRGTVLYREWSARPPTTTALEYAVEGLMTDPADPDYRTAWRAGWLHSASTGSGLIRVQLGDAPAARPRSMTAQEAAEAIQQVVYTVQAAAQKRDRVQFTRHGRPAESVLGVSTAQPVSQGKVLDVLSLMNITDPAEGVHQSRGRLVVTGVNNSFEAHVLVRLVRNGTTYLAKPGMASGAYENRLFPWRLTLDTSKLEPGRYLLIASNGDGKGGGNVDQDTRTIYLK